MVFGSPFSDKYSKRILESLKKSRKGKDVFASLYNFVNSTRIYEHVLKHTHRYWLFTIFGGCISCFCLSSVCDCIWKHVNKGRLYIDLKNDEVQVESEE
ncbi:ubiquinol-cytochrome C reductase UQCRX/QCR9-like family protein [Theileria parva strain Muguga]|uniref:ubiquinol-cytochrome C reductase UQCRX/QCR9-like family protein n=1 Tax=Theileria parva strain Muguga TaxID=333668 RepID=UPI001C61C49A|nr:ubiquinol-cytochrome C reductase UQCRX/QCR9-like family protein [Theileria parva strain Muguga]KAF5153266.1 ubiquinol-cytochrome C reductase UQCRX/QCR9-like family protein [Theileria parva strain Muguga]